MYDSHFVFVQLPQLYIKDAALPFAGFDELGLTLKRTKCTTFVLDESDLTEEKLRTLSNRCRNENVEVMRVKIQRDVTFYRRIGFY